MLHEESVSGNAEGGTCRLCIGTCRALQEHYIHMFATEPKSMSSRIPQQKARERWLRRMLQQLRRSSDENTARRLFWSGAVSEMNKGIFFAVPSSLRPFRKSRTCSSTC